MPNSLKKKIALNIETVAALPEPVDGQGLAICVFQGEEQTASVSISEGEFKAEAGASALIHGAGPDGVTRSFLLVGCGSRDEFTPAVLRNAAGMAFREANSASIKHLFFQMPETNEAALFAGAAVEGALLGSYDGGFYKTNGENVTQLTSFTIIQPEATDEIHAAIARARIVAEAANWTRVLSDTPGRDLPPTVFAQRAAEMAEEFGLIVESLNVDEVRHRGMGALIGVGKGSDEPPALIVIRYEPPDLAGDEDLLALIGKGITFDTGGISLKHGLDMYEMKADMAGGAAVLGAMRAIAQIKPRQRVVGIVPAAENSPSGRAIKPGDVVTTLAGYTVEVIDTDAEGRLVLIDGIAFAKQLGATRIVDLATLTGSIIMALGDHRAGLFSNNDEWAKKVTDAAERVGEPVWRMPVNDDYKKRIESAIADFKNYGGRPDATGAALLLSKFAGDTPWVHLDIAGTAWYDDPQPYAPKGSSGAGVRTLVELVCSRASDNAGIVK